MNRMLHIIPVLALGACAANPALADHRQGYRDYDRAPVTRVVPIIETVEINEPYRSCRTETIHYRGARHSATPAILGGIFGGLVGSQIGKGGGNVAATVAGVVLGSSIASDLDRGRYVRRGYYRPGQVCETGYTRRYEDHVVGYEVTYRYHGRLYRTRCDEDPGSHITIRIRN